MIACVNGNLTTIQNPSQLIQGTVGQKMRVAIPEEMQDLAVTAVFTAGSVQRDVAVLGEEITIPWELLADPAQDLRLCFHASSANGQRVFTTANSDPLKILPSTPPSGQAPEAPTPTRADQIQALAEDALAAAQSVRRDADSGAFDGTDGVNGQDGISPLVAVREISGGHTISITDAEGVKSFDVLDGADGEVLQSDLDELEASVADTLETKADIDGSYDDMTVGNAGQLVSTVYTNDRTPYLFRTAGGSADIGDRLTEKIIGGTIAWNQYAKALNGDNWAGTNGDTTWTDAAAKYTITTVAAANYNNRISTRYNFAAKPHVYFAGFTHRESKTGLRVFFTNVASNVGAISDSSTSWIRSYGIGKITDPGAVGDTKWLAFRLQDGTGAGAATRAVGDWMEVKDAIFIDLTQMFGSAIADYIYTLEQNTAGAGAAFFRKLFPKPYYAYDAGSLQSVKASAHKTVGFNAWDEEWEVGGLNVDGTTTIDNTKIRSKNYIPVIAGATYYCKTPNSSTYAVFFDSNKTSISSDYTRVVNETFSVPANAAFMKIRVGSSNFPITTYNHDICINLSWDGERNGEYEPYVQHTYPLDSDLELRGIPKLDANNSLYYDGDEYASDGTVTRKYGTRAYQSGDESLADAITDGTNTVYKLAAPATESADSFQSSQIVDDFGTEEYVDAAVAANSRDVAVPVGHDTNYQANLRAKLEMAPVSPDSGGDYIVRHTHGQNSYIAYTDGGRISGLEERLPAPPSVDGVYCLRVTISGGAAQYAWEAC